MVLEANSQRSMINRHTERFTQCEENVQAGEDRVRKDFADIRSELNK